MAIYSKQCRNNDNTETPNAFGLNKSNVYCYGADRNYEVKDKTGLIKEIGCITMGIEKLQLINDVEGLTDGKDAKAAFSINVVDRVPKTLKVLDGVVNHVKPYSKDAAFHIEQAIGIIEKFKGV